MRIVIGDAREADEVVGVIAAEELVVAVADDAVLDNHLGQEPRIAKTGAESQSGGSEGLEHGAG
jgi:RNA 3'-terminal phosphate cyclase